MLFIDETKRSDLPDSEFGIPEDRKFPLDTAEHVHSAIKLFGHAEESKRKSLAKRIASKAKSYGIEIPETSQVYKYLHENSNMTADQVDAFYTELKKRLAEDDEVITESAILESSKNNYKKIYDITIKMFKDSGRLPNADNGELKQFLATGKTDEFGGALCIAGLGTGFEATCGKINKEIKPLGGRIYADNYGCAFLSIKEDAILTDEENNNDLDLPDGVQDDATSLVELLDSVDPKHIYLSSDWHISKNHYTHEKNAVNTSEIVSWCKEHIKDDDIFMYLGDMTYRWANDEDKENAKKIFKSLPGIKILIIGNHDEFSDGGNYEEYGFKYAVKELHYKNIIFSHRPIDMCDKPGMWNCHGHKHKDDTDYHMMDGEANVNVYPSFHNNKPITLDRAIKHKDYYMRNNKRSDWNGMGESAELIKECSDMIEDQLNREDYITEDATLIASVAFLVAIFGMDLYSKLSPKIDKFKKDREYAYYISDKEIFKQPKYGYSDIKFALCNYAYYTLNINKSEKNTLIVSNSNKSNLNKHVYAYKFNKNSTKLVEDDTFENLCKKHNINIKEMDDSKLSDRKKVYNQALKLFKDELKNNKDIISKGKWGYYEKDDYDDFIDGRKNYTDIYSCDLWKLDPQARTNYGSEEQNTKIWDPIINAIKVVNDKLPKGYKIESDGDWDDIYIVLYHNEKIYKEWAMASFNPVIGIQKPYILKAVDNTGNCINSKLYALSPDVISDKYLVVDENSKLSIVDKSYFDNYCVEVYEYTGNELNVGKIKEAYDNGNIVSPNYIYEVLSGKDLLSDDQIDFDESFKKVDFEEFTAKTESYMVTMQRDYDKINGALFYVPTLENAVSEVSLRFRDALDCLEDLNGYYLENRLTHMRTKSVPEFDDFTEAMIKSIL